MTSRKEAKAVLNCQDVALAECVKVEESRSHAHRHSWALLGSVRREVVEDLVETLLASQQHDLLLAGDQMVLRHRHLDTQRTLASVGH